MKNNIKFLYLLVLLGALGASAYFYQNKQNTFVNEQGMFGGRDNGLTVFQEKIVDDFGKGNVAELMTDFDEEVSLTIFGEDDFYTKEEAVKVLLEFFQNHRPEQFIVKHNGSNQRKSSYYLIGELRTTEKKRYRVYISNSEDKLENIEITNQRNM